MIAEQINGVISFYKCTNAKLVNFEQILFYAI
jgi:hypothetical protein